MATHRYPLIPAADVPVTPQKLGPVVVQGNNKNPASAKLQRVRKWSISTYKVRLGCPSLINKIASIRAVLISGDTLVPAVHQAGSAGEAGPRISHGGSGPGASPRAAQRRPPALRKHHQDHSDSGQSAGSVHGDPEDPGGRLQRSQPQNATAERESEKRTTMNPPFVLI